MKSLDEIFQKINLAKEFPVLNIMKSDLGRIKAFIESIDDLKKVSNLMRVIN